jgi:chromosome segregation ATPase
MHKNLFKSFSLLALAALLVGALALAFPSGSVSAQGPNLPDDTEAQDRAAHQIERLERQYQRELKLSEAQEERFAMLDERIQDARERIDEFKADGKDVSALEEALQDFQSEVEEARASHNDAAAILKTHAGFDTAGKVTDADAARETLREAAELHREARRDLRPALRKLARAFREFIRDNRSV